MNFKNLLLFEQGLGCFDANQFLILNNITESVDHYDANRRRKNKNSRG